MLRAVPYPYLVASLVLLYIFLGGLVVTSRHRRLALLSGLLSAPFAMTSVFFVPYYWSPVRLANFSAGPEDFIFSFACGGIAWLLAIWPYRRRITVSLSWERFLGRYLVWTGVGMSLSAVCWYSGFGPMEAVLTSFTTTGIVLLVRRFDLWLLSVTGGTRFVLFYSLSVTVAVLVWPDLGTYWNPKNLWGPRILAVPLEEIVWAAGFGTVWPLWMGHVFDARLISEGR